MIYKLFGSFDRDDFDGFAGNVREVADGAGFDRADLLDNVDARSDLTKDAVAVATGIGCGEIEEVIVNEIDEKLCGCAMGIGCASHGDGAFFIGKLVAGFIFNWGKSLLLIHLAIKATALDHEIVDHAVKDGAVVEAAIDVAEEVCNRLGGLFVEELERDITGGGFNGD